MSASEKLTTALREAHAPADMIQLAMNGFYGDFTSPMSTPIMQLVFDARRHRLEDIAKRAIAGEFDGE